MTEQAAENAQPTLALVRAGLDALAAEAEGKYIVPGVDVVRRARALSALCDSAISPAPSTPEEGRNV